MMDALIGVEFKAVGVIISARSVRLLGWGKYRVSEL